MTSETRLFPILVPHGVAERAVIGDLELGQQMTLVCAIPWSMIEPFERQAKKNHRHGLEHLALRGGLDASEAIAVISGWSLWDKRRLQWREANDRLARLVARYTAQELTAA